jgi:hypothetical protein
MDPAPNPGSMLRPDLEPVTRRLRPRGPDGRLLSRLRQLVPRIPPPRPMRQYNHSPTYQCFGDFFYVDLRRQNPPSDVEGQDHPLENRQHHSVGVCQERGGDMQSPNPGDSSKDSNQGSSDVICLLPVYVPLEENILADAASRFLEIPAWHLHHSVFRAISTRWGLPSIDLFATQASKQTHRFFSWDASDRPDAVDALAQKWDFTLAFAFPPTPLLKSDEETRDVEGDIHLYHPILILTLDVLEVCRLPFFDDLVTDLRTGKPPPILRNLRLVAWRISGGAKASTTSPSTLAISSRLGGVDPQKNATIEPGSTSRTSFTPPEFHSIAQV